jgi:CTP:phosphocholine cytidylyltransferase-like protein
MNLIYYYFNILDLQMNSSECQLIYQSVSEEIMKDQNIESQYFNNSENVLPMDFSLNENPNDTIQDIFIYEIDKAIETGNINFINNAIKDFGHLIDHSYVEWANSISLQIVEEKIEDMDI